jgi:hypothetical protein
MHRLLQVTLLLVASVCAGCVSVGDGLLTVRGRLSGPNSEAGCSLTLALAREAEARPYNTRAIKQEFFEDFTVAPSSRNYRITIGCPGYTPVQKVVHSTGSITRVDLGTIVLSR